jgi:hypothetical protein
MDGKSNADIPAAQAGMAPILTTTVEGEPNSKAVARRGEESVNQHVKVNYTWMLSLVHELGEVSGKRIVEKFAPGNFVPEKEVHPAYSMVYGPVLFRKVVDEMKKMSGVKIGGGVSLERQRKALKER